MQLEAQSRDLDYGFLLLTHIVCVDEQVHIEESKRVAILMEELHLNAATQKEAEKILNLTDDRISAETSAENVPNEVTVR